MQPKQHTLLTGLDDTTCVCCGARYATCPHFATHAYNIDPEHAERIRARYAIAARFGGPDFERAEADIKHAVSSRGLSAAAAHTDPGFVPIRVPRKLNGDLLATVVPRY